MDLRFKDVASKYGDRLDISLFFKKTGGDSEIKKSQR
jgi:hypothetical protein